MKTLSRKRQYLDAMGIDVWSIRPATPAPLPTAKGKSPLPDLVKAIGAPPEAAAKSPVNQTTKVKQNEAAPADQTAEVPEFRFALLHYGSFGICISLQLTDNLPRRFCDDLARVMGGDIEGLRYHELTWPMLSTSGIDQSVNAAREVVTQKFRTLPARVLVIGEDVAEYFGPLRDASDEPRVVGSQSFLLIPSMNKTAGSAEIKRSLFLTMKRWQDAK